RRRSRAGAPDRQDRAGPPRTGGRAGAIPLFGLATGAERQQPSRGQPGGLLQSVSRGRLTERTGLSSNLTPIFSVSASLGSPDQQRHAAEVNRDAGNRSSDTDPPPHPDRSATGGEGSRRRRRPQPDHDPLPRRLRVREPAGDAGA